MFDDVIVGSGSAGRSCDGVPVKSGGNRSLAVPEHAPENPLVARYPAAAREAGPGDNPDVNGASPGDANAPADLIRGAQA